MVLEGGPSDGVLQVGDVITGVGGVSMSTAQDVVDAVMAASSGDTLSIAIKRGGNTMTVSVTVGERDAPAAPERKAGRKGGAMGGAGKFAQMVPNFGAFEYSVKNDDGSYSTYAGARGTVSNVNESAGTFTLTPGDGSAAISYTIATSTVVLMSRTGDLGGLDTEQETVVLSENGAVTHVLQGEWATQRIMPKKGFRSKMRIQKGRGQRGWGVEGPVFHFRQYSADDLPPEIREMFERRRGEERERRWEGSTYQFPSG